MRIAILIAISLFIVACTAAPAPVQQEQTPPPAEETGQENNEPSEPTVPVVESRDVATVFDGLPEDIQDILENGRTNTETKGFSYKLNIIEDKYQSSLAAQGAMVYQRGNLLKIELPDPKQRVDAETYIDTVYMNLEEQTATGACNDVVLCKGAIGGRTADYADYDFMTPTHWVEHMDDPVKMEEKTVQNRKAVRLDATVDGALTSIWVDRFSGLPIQVNQGTTVYNYESFALGAKESDVTP